MALPIGLPQTQPSLDAVQRFAVQTSNFAAEYGQAGGGVFNVTMRSGTNQLHGSAYDYFVNEALSAGTPWNPGLALPVPDCRLRDKLLPSTIFRKDRYKGG
jgi:hypothetical protein